MKKNLFAVIILLTALSSSASAKEAFIQKGSFSAGATFAHIQLDSDNSEAMLILNPVTARGGATLIAPFAELAYSDNHSLGIRFNYFNAQMAVDNITLDLLNDGLQFDITDISENMTTYGGSLYHRRYYGIDSKNRLAAFSEFALGLTCGHSDSGNDGQYAKSMRARLSYSPGLMFFVMNNVSVSVSVSMASLTYNSVKCITDGQQSGFRSKFGTKLGPDITGANFGIAVYF